MRRFLLVAVLFACWDACAANVKMQFCKADSELIRFTGRAAHGDDGSLTFDWSGSHFTFRFDGSACSMRASDTNRNYYNVFVDGKLYGKATVAGPSAPVPLAEGLAPGPHTVTVQKRTEAEQGRTTLYGIAADGDLLPLPAAPARLIEFIGDSHTCGYGTEGKSCKEPFTPQTENCDLAWGCITARYFGADYVLLAHSGQGLVRNWGEKREKSDETMCDRILRTFDVDAEARVPWPFRAYKPDIVVIKLGTNDFCEGTPTERAFNDAFTRVYGCLRERYVAVPILYLVPPGSEPYYRYLQAIRKKLNDANLHCVMYFDEINNWTSDLGAGYHPNYPGQRKMAMAVIPYIATITGWEMPSQPVQ